MLEYHHVLQSSSTKRCDHEIGKGFRRKFSRNFFPITGIIILWPACRFRPPLPSPPLPPPLLPSLLLLLLIFYWEAALLIYLVLSMTTLALQWQLSREIDQLLAVHSFHKYVLSTCYEPRVWIPAFQVGVDVFGMEGCGWTENCWLWSQGGFSFSWEYTVGSLLCWKYTFPHPQIKLSTFPFILRKISMEIWRNLPQNNIVNHLILLALYSLSLLS